jgi:hypothetical protein
MILNEKSLNCKVVYLDESYNFRTKIISIQVYKKYDFLNREAQNDFK